MLDGRWWSEVLCHAWGGVSCCVSVSFLGGNEEGIVDWSGYEDCDVQPAFVTYCVVLFKMLYLSRPFVHPSWHSHSVYIIRAIKCISFTFITMYTTYLNLHQSHGTFRYSNYYYYDHYHYY